VGVNSASWVYFTIFIRFLLKILDCHPTPALPIKGREK
jgi:hypothetical protein